MGSGMHCNIGRNGNNLLLAFQCKEPRALLLRFRMTTLLCLREEFVSHRLYDREIGHIQS